MQHPLSLFYIYVILHARTCAQNHFTCIEICVHKYQICQALFFQHTIFKNKLQLKDHWRSSREDKKECWNQGFLHWGDGGVPSLTKNVPTPLTKKNPLPNFNFPALNNNFHFQLQSALTSLLMYHFHFNFILFVHTGHDNFDFN